MTKLLGLVKWTYFYLYVILDVFSRYEVGWMVAKVTVRSWRNASLPMREPNRGLEPGRLTIRGDRGSSLIPKPGAFLLADLGFTTTYSRPHVSDGNPYSESHFRSLKYRPEFLERFGSLQDARSFSEEFFAGYNNEHGHSRLCLLCPAVVYLRLWCISGCGVSPAVVYHRQAPDTIKRRRVVLDAAYRAYPERFGRKPPPPLPAPKEVWINKQQRTPEN